MCDICHNQICPGECPSADFVEYYCPVCGAWYPEAIYLDSADNIVGCESCLKIRDADTYFAEKNYI